jgi:IclR family mhp operon transcriptional activator
MTHLRWGDCCFFAKIGGAPAASEEFRRAFHQVKRDGVRAMLRAMADRSPSTKSVRALERGLDILQTLETNPGVDLKALHAITRLPKPTLLRLLRTLIGRNFVWQRLADGAYLPSRRTVRTTPDAEAPLAEAASPVMAKLGERVGWPSVLSVRAGGEMVVLETNRPLSTTPHFPLGPVGARVPLLSSSTGRAYFAFCGPDEREEILQVLRTEPAARDRAWIARLVAEIQAQGYAAREPLYPGEPGEAPRPPDDGRGSIAVPVIASGRVAATLNLTWTRRTTSLAHIVAEHLPALRAAAAEIARGLEPD